MDRRLFFTLATFVILLFHLWLVYKIAAPFLRPLGWAGVIGVLTFPIYRRLRLRLKGRDTVAAALMTAAVVVTLVTPVVVMIVFLAQEISQVYAYLQKVTAGGQASLLGTLRAHPTVAPVLEGLHQFFQRLGLTPEEHLIPALDKVMNFALSYSTAILVNSFGFAIKVILMVITLFFIFRDGEKYEGHFWSVVPLEDAHKNLIDATIKRVLSGVIFGIFLTCVVQGIMGGIGFWFCGLPSPLLFGAMMAIAALIPIVGTALIWLPAALYLYLEGKIFLAFVLLAWGVLVVSAIDNVIRPFLISGKAHIPVLVVAVGALGGLVSFGLLGVVFGPLVLSLFIAIFGIYREQVHFPVDEV
jgi:predicted PurR-regulated permease PerM